MIGRRISTSLFCKLTRVTRLSSQFMFSPRPTSYFRLPVLVHAVPGALNRNNACSLVVVFPEPQFAVTSTLFCLRDSVSPSANVKEKCQLRVFRNRYEVRVYFVMCMSKQSGVIGPNSAFVMYVVVTVASECYGRSALKEGQ